MADDLKDHEPSAADVEVQVPALRRYGITQPGGMQIMYTSRPSQGGASIMVHPDHLARVLRAIEGSKVIEASAPVSAPEPPAAKAPRNAAKTPKK